MARGGAGRTGTENNRANNLRDYRGPGCWFPIGWARPLAAYLVPLLSLSPSIGEANSSLLLLPHPCRPFCIFYSAFHVLPRATHKSTVNNARSSEPRPALPACRIAETLFSFCGTRKYVSEDWPRYRPNNSKLNFMPAEVQKNKVWRNNWWIIKLFVRDEEWWKAKLWRDIGKIKETWLIYLAR